MLRCNHNWLTAYGRMGLLSALSLSYITAHAAEPQLPHRVIVQKGDVLSSLLRREIGRSNPSLWRLVAEFNNRTVNQTLEIGDVLLLPAELMAPQVVFIEERKVIPPSEPLQSSTNNSLIEPTNTLEPNTTDTPEVEINVEKVEQIIKPAVTPDIEPTDIPAEPEAAPEIQQEIQPKSPVKRQQSQPQETEKEQPADNPPPKKPGLFEVDEDSAVRALERSLIQLNALLLRPRRAEVSFSYDYSFNEESEPVLVAIEDTTTGESTQQAGQLKQQQSGSTFALGLKFGLPFRSQINLTLPFSSITRDFDIIVPGNQSNNQTFTSDGAGDFAVSVDKTLTMESGKRPDLIFSTSYNSDTGANEIGSNAKEYSVGFNITKRQDPLVFTASVSRTFAQKSDNGIKAGDVTQFSVGTLLAASPYTSVRFLFTQATVASAELNGQSIPDSDANIASFVTGVSSVLGADLFFNAQLSMGLVEQASDYRISFSIAKQFSY